MKSATVWGWGEELDLAGENAEKYLNKRWKSTTKECSITLLGRISMEDGDLLFRVTAYISNKPKDTQKLVDDLLSASLVGSKVYFVTIGLYDHVVSDQEMYRNDLQAVEQAYRNRDQTLLQKFKEHPEVKALLKEGKELVIIPTTTVLCEMESKRVEKVIVDANNSDLDEILSAIHLLAKRLIERKVATRVVGYSMKEEEMEIEDMFVEEDEVCLWLGPAT
jgi:hypothetical protein